MTAPDLSTREAGKIARFSLTPDAPESLRERVAAAIAAEDQRSLLSGPLGWPETRRRWPEAIPKYLSMADAAIATVSESALR